jgi:hypothetical protein
MRARRLILLLVIAAVASLGTTSSLFAQSPTAPTLPGTTQQISVANGNQTNPHVACGIASYTNDDLEGSSTIRYFDFATNTEHVLPGNGLDRLSDTDGRRIVFTELGATGDTLVLYDTASQATTFIPGLHNFDPAIGGNLVAFVHGLSQGSFDIGVYDWTTGITTQLTGDGLFNRHPAVSPDGKVVVWEKCQNNGTGCDIYSATQTGPGTFTTRLLTGAGEDTHADTNGQLVAYISDKGGENDIYLRRVDGSNEMHIALPGDQRDVRISGHLLVFESGTLPYYDVFVYDLSTARLYQVTNTPNAGETLSDVITGCDGLNRIVYAVPGTFGDFDVWEFSFQLNDSVSDQLSDLIALVQSFNLHDGIEASLISKVQDALAAVNNSDTATACDSLTAFINASQAQSGKKLTATQVKQLTDAAALIKTDLGCK